MRRSINLAAKANGSFRANYKAGLTVCNWPISDRVSQINHDCRI
jgi:hypothetical protein